MFFILEIYQLVFFVRPYLTEVLGYHGCSPQALGTYPKSSSTLRWLSNKDTSIFNLHFCRARIRPLLMTHPTRAIAPIILKDYLQIRPATSKRFVYFVYPSCTLCTLDQRDLLSCLPAGYVSVLSASNPFNFHWVNGLCTNDFIHSSDPQCTTRLAINVQGTGRVRSAPWDEGWADSKLVAKFA